MTEAKTLQNWIPNAVANDKANCNALKNYDEFNGKDDFGNFNLKLLMYRFGFCFYEQRIFLQLRKMNVIHLAIYRSKMAFFKRAWWKVKVLPRP